MTLKAHERDVMYFDLFVRRRAEHAPFPPLGELAVLWQLAHAEKIAPKGFEHNTVSAIVADVKIDFANEIATVLLSVADSMAPNLRYANHKTRDARTVAKEKEEGNEHSAHLIMSLRPRKGEPNTYPCMVERVPSLGANRIQSILNDVINRYCKQTPHLFTYKAAGGDKKPKAFIPSVLLGIVPSEEFEQDVEAGKLHGLRLVKTVPQQSLGTGPWLKVVDYSMNVKISPNIPKGQRWKEIAAAVKAKSADYSRARLYLAPQEGGSSASFEFDADTGALIGEVYARRRRIGPLNPMLENGSSTIVEHLEAEMIKLLEAERA